MILGHKFSKYYLKLQINGKFIFPFAIYTFLDLVCVGEPRSDDNFLCSDGETADSLSGCYDRGSVRLQCPSGHYPCNNLREDSNYQEFLCEPDCTDFGGYRDCFYQ